jgi:hypothetical protein
MGYRIPSILAYSRFLALEPESQRALRTLPVLQGLLVGGVSKSGENRINITFGAPAKGLKDEGDFMGAEMMLSIMVAGDLIEKPGQPKDKPASPFERLVTLYTAMGESLKNSKPKGGFAATYYVPYFAALVEAGHTEAFVTQAWKAGNLEGAAEWAKANDAKLPAFRAWSQAFRWPVKK